MSLRQELRESPATYGLGALWVLVYVALNFAQGGFSLNEISLLGFGAVRTDTSHLFGDLTWRDFSHGEPWRAVTATFIHFSLAHLVLNLIGLIQLGRMIEEWYGSKQFFAICLVLGGVGNVIGVCMRQGVSQSVAWLLAHGLARVLPDFLKKVAGGAENTPAAGGSTIILGLIGLGLIVGWRSRTRIGLYLRDQMFGFLFFTGAIGVVCWNVIDNYGHTGGAIAGILVGFLHRFLVKRPEGGLFRKVELATAFLLIASCALLQARDARHDLVELRREQASKLHLVQMARYRVLREQLVFLGSQFELVAYERLGPILTGSVLDPATLNLPVDLSPIFEVAQYGQRPNLPPDGPPPQAVANLRMMLSQLRQLRTTLDPTIDGPEFDDLERIGTELCTRLPSSKDILEFRIARFAIIKRVSAALNTLMSEPQQSPLS